MPPPRFQPTLKEKRKAFRRCFDASTLLLSFLIYRNHVYPLVERVHGADSQQHTAMKYANAIATMLALRQLHEFFLPSENRRDIRALHFGYIRHRPLLANDEKQKIDQTLIHLSFDAFRFRNTPRNLARYMRKAIIRYLAFVKHCERRVFSKDANTSAEIEKIQRGFAHQLALIKAYEGAETGP